MQQSIACEVKLIKQKPILTVFTICVSIVMAENRWSTTQMLKFSVENERKTT